MEKKSPATLCALQANAEGALTLAGFGSGNPITAENYTGNTFTTYRGRACAVLRSGYEAGEAKLTVDGGKLGACSAALTVKSL